jgi:hypothetical protein
MTYKNFLKITMGLQKCGRDIDQLHKMKVDLLDFVEPYHEIITSALCEIYTAEGIDWLNWFMYESDFGQKDWSTSPLYEDVDGKLILNDKVDGQPRHGAHDADGNPICYSFESTWEFLKQYLKTK